MLLMTTTAHFDLVARRSYRTSPSGSPYIFYKGKPLPVASVEDANFFRAQPEVFVEVDSEGNYLVEETHAASAKSYRRFREANLEIPTNAEQLLNESFKSPAIREPVDTRSLIEMAEKDAEGADMNLEHVKREEKAAAVAVQEKPSVPKVTKQIKQKVITDGKFRCTTCGQGFDNKQKLAAHIEDHEEED
jgi:hypothetical protein